MAELNISQIVVSTGASIGAGVSLFLWLFVVSDFNLARLALFRQNPIILAQAVLGILILTGLLATVALSVYQPVFRGDPSRPVLTIEVGFLLLLPGLNEFLLLVRQHLRSINILAIFPASKILILSSYFFNDTPSKVRHLLLILVLAITSLELLFFAIQYFRLWRTTLSCTPSWPRVFLHHQPSKSRRFLKAAALTATSFWLISGAITISAHFFQESQTQLATVQVGVLSLMKLVTTFFLTKEFRPVDDPIVL